MANEIGVKIRKKNNYGNQGKNKIPQVAAGDQDQFIQWEKYLGNDHHDRDEDCRNGEEHGMALQCALPEKFKC
jgi:hypothetical protein